MSNLEINPNVEYILAGDISGSMSEKIDRTSILNRYEYMLEKFKCFIKEAEDFDKHGAPTVMLFGENVHTYDHVKLDNIKTQLNNVNFEGFTNLHLLLRLAFDKHLDEQREDRNHPGTCLMVFTDGAPTNRAAVERELIYILSKIKSEDEFQIHFLTVGDELACRDWLEKLHDELEDKKVNPRDFDIVHVSRLEDVNFIKASSYYKHELEEEKKL